MTVVVEDSRAVGGLRVHWSAVIAGALVVAALALVLHTFAAAIGLGVSSTAPTWRDSSVALWILSGLYLVLAALASYGLGGYVAGWITTWSDLGDPDDLETSNGLHGLIVWAIATLLTVLMLGVAVLSVARATASPVSVSAGPAASVGSENLIAFDLDRLFRADGRYPQSDFSRARAEAGRILLTTSSHSGMSTEDRQYLIRLTAAQTGLSPADAERRVDTVAGSARSNINRARRSAVLLAFMAGASALLGAAAAWFAACAGAAHGRDRSLKSIWGTNWNTRRTASSLP